MNNVVYSNHVYSNHVFTWPDNRGCAQSPPWEKSAAAPRPGGRAAGNDYCYCYYYYYYYYLEAGRLGGWEAGRPGGWKVVRLAGRDLGSAARGLSETAQSEAGQQGKARSKYQAGLPQSSEHEQVADSFPRARRSNSTDRHPRIPLAALCTSTRGDGGLTCATGVCEETLLFCEPFSCNAAAETALQPLILRFQS